MQILTASGVLKIAWGIGGAIIVGDNFFSKYCQCSVKLVHGPLSIIQRLSFVGGFISINVPNKANIT